MTKIALIPAYEPSDTLCELVEKLVAAGLRVVIIDDGSSEDKKRVFTAAEKYAAVIHHEVNRGKGRALKTGLEYIAANFKDGYVVVTLDADGQHSLDDTLRVCAAAEERPGTLVLGSRSFGGSTPARSRFGNTVTRFVYRLATGVKVRDTQTGLRAFGDSLAAFMLTIGGERYEYEMNVLLECTRKKIPIEEIGIETIYFDGNSGSHFDTVKDSWRVYREILKFAASSFIGFLTDYGMYSLLAWLTSGLGNTFSVTFSNITARVISAAVNFSINRKFVFKSKDGLVKTAAQYFALAACILAGNTLLLNLMTGSWGMNKYLAKVITEIIFFSLSWLVQRFIIFKKKTDEEGKK